MKKILSIVLAVMMLSLIATMVNAEIVQNRTGDARVKTETFRSALQGDAANSITAPYNRLLGYDFSDSSAGWVSLHDTTSTTTATTATTSLSEATVAAGDTVQVRFPLVMEISNGLTVVTKNNTGICIVYYE